MPDPPSPAPSAPKLFVSDQVIGDYEIKGELGRGGMGMVYRARQITLNRIVALKMLTGRYAPDELTRFLAEAETAAGLHHTNIVQIYEVGEMEGAPFFSMEYVESGTLADRLRIEPIEEREAAQLLISVARALHFAHRNGVVHRDMKPANILLDPEGVPKVADFGIAKRLTANSALTLSGAVIGTPTYMAPEQAKGTSRDVGAAADVYSLGAILYEMLSGRPPFLPEDSETALTVRVITEDAVSPAFYRPGIPRDLETICLKCLEKEPRDRYESAAAFAEDLRRYLDDESIMARPPTTVVRTLKWIRRHPWRSVTAAAVLLTAGAMVQRLWQWEFYQRPHLEYAATVDFLNGALEPSVRIDAQQLEHVGVKLRLTRRGRSGPITLLEVLNARGNPAVPYRNPMLLRRMPVQATIPIYTEGLMGAQPLSGKSPESTRVEFSYDGDVAVEATGRDRNGNVNWRVLYDRPIVSKDGRSVVRARFANLWGFEASRSSASHLEFQRDAAGRDVKVSFFNGSGEPAPNGEGLYGYKLERDPAGRLVRIFNLGRDGKPAENRAGMVALAFTLDSAGRITRQVTCNGAGQPMLWDGVAAISVEYDSAGNATRVTSLGTDGKPAPFQYGGWLVNEIVRNERGEITAHKFLDPSRGSASSLLAQMTLTYDEFGHPSEIQSSDSLGAASRYLGLPDKFTARVVRQYDQSGNITEEKYLDALGLPKTGSLGYATRRIVYESGPNGHRSEETYFDADGTKAYSRESDERCHRKIAEFYPTGLLQRQTADELDPTGFRAHRKVSEPEYNSQGHLQRTVMRFEDDQGRPILEPELGYAVLELTYDVNSLPILSWELGCPESEGAPVFRTDTEWYRDGGCERTIRQACDLDRKPMPTLSGGEAALVDERFAKGDRLESIDETGFNEELVGFSSRESKFSEGSLQSVIHKRRDGTVVAVRVIVTAVGPEQAKEAGLAAGDQLLSVNGKTIRTVYDREFMDSPGGWIEVLRDGQTIRLEGLKPHLSGLTLQDRAVTNP